MTFTPKSWQDASGMVVGPDTNGHYWRINVGTSGALTTTDLGTSAPSTTPLTAAALADMETRLAAYADLFAPASSSGQLKTLVGFQAFTSLGLTSGSFQSLTVNHTLGSVPSSFFVFITMQDGGLSVPYGTYVQGSLTSSVFHVGIGNPYSFTLTNAQVGWMIVHS